MKTRRTILFSLILSLALLLSACAGGIRTQNWAGVSVDQGKNIAYLAYGPHVYALNIDPALGVDAERLLWQQPFKPEKNAFFYAPPGTTTDNHQVIIGGFNNKLTSYNPDKTDPNVPDNRYTNWSFTGANDWYVGASLITEDAIYAPNDDFNLYKLDLNGNQKWSFPTGNTIWAQPVKDGDKVFVASMDHYLYAIDDASGNKVWDSGELGGAITGGPTLGPDGTLYLGTLGNAIMAIDSANGKQKWNKTTDGWVWAAPALADGKLYFGDTKGNLYSLSAEDGKQNWKVNLDTTDHNSITGTPLVQDGVVYFGTKSGKFFAVEADSGKQVWPTPLELKGGVYGTILGAGETILVPSYGATYLYAVDKDGRLLWSYPAPKK